MTIKLRNRAVTSLGNIGWHGVARCPELPGQESIMISVCVCELQPIVVEGLRAVLEQSEEIALAASAEHIEQVQQQIERHHPQVALIDRAFGLHTLLEWIPSMRRIFPATQFVVWSSSHSDVESFRLLQAGARGVLRKESAVAALFHCLRTVAQGELWTESLFNSDHSPLRSSRSRPLTPREQQVAELVSKGMKNREIAEALQIATGTVKIHLMHIFEKTGIRDRFELALHGLRLACEQEPAAAPLPARDPAFSPPR